MIHVSDAGTRCPRCFLSFSSRHLPCIIICAQKWCIKKDLAPCVESPAVPAARADIVVIVIMPCFRCRLHGQGRLLSIVHRSCVWQSPAAGVRSWRRQPAPSVERQMVVFFTLPTPTTIATTRLFLLSCA
mmetsp:Transcript_23303/g.51198  ORF Transcript_23303/g.51198 Transcript_23303/m.51198 type:complete len:130 (+) Transcript_23303:3292-3681(+)